MSRVDERDPAFADAVRSAFSSQGIPVMIAFVLSYLRILYDDREPKPVRQLIEALLGSMIVLAIGLTCEKFGLSSGYSYAASGLIGTLGVNQVRTIARRWATRKIEQ